MDRQRGGGRREGLGGERRDRKGKMTARVGMEVGTLPGSRILQQSPEAECQSTKGHTLTSVPYLHRSMSLEFFRVLLSYFSMSNT